MKTITFKSTLLILTIATFLSCNKVSGPSRLSEESFLRLSLTTPLTAPPQSKATVSGDADQQIKSVYVFLFRQDGASRDLINDKVYSVVKGEYIADTQTGNTKQFEVKMAVEQQYMDSDFYCYAISNIADFMNTDDNLRKMVGKGYNELYAFLNGDFIATTDLIMWGESSATFKPSSDTELSLNMLRSLSRVDVGVGAYNHVSGEWNNTTTNVAFLLKEIYIYRPNKKVSFMPSSTHKPIFSATPYKVLGHSAIGGQELADPAPSPNTVTSTSTTVGNFHEEIYLPESNVMYNDPTPGNMHHTERCAIVVGGLFEGRAISYYRVDFMNPDVAGTVMDVLRNHLYRVIIKDVWANGYNDPTEAYESKRTNMSVTIESWEQKNQEIIFDGVNWLSIQKKEIVLPGSNNVPGELAVSSNVDLSRWKMGFDKLTLTEEDTKESDDFIVTKTKNTGTNTAGVLTFRAKSTHTGSTPKTGIVTIQVDRLEFPINIIQINDDPANWIPGEDFPHDF